MILRKCKDCGLEAHTEEDLELFEKGKKYKYGRRNYCKKCNHKMSFNWKQNNKEKHTAHVLKWQKNNLAKVSAKSARRRAAKLNATPAWADHEIIKDFYLEAQYHGMEVDHIIPLQHEMVCGLHVEHNLQLLTKEQNCSKGNSFED